jgi:transketolase
MAKYNTQRDIFISELMEFAKNDKDIVLISVDMGAPALDDWRALLPNQFFSAGISEQHGINLAAGLAAEGKKVYVYFMASWAARCFEQVRYSCSMGKNPITVVGNGVALGYAPAGPAHEPNEDIGYMRTIHDIEIYSPADLKSIPALVQLTLQKPALRYVRLERSVAPETAKEYPVIDTVSAVEIGLSLVKGGLRGVPSNRKVALLSSGYLMGRALNAQKKLLEKGIEISTYDLWRVKPLPSETLKAALEDYDYVVTLEEQSLDGNFGSAICEFICDNQIPVKVLRIGLPSRYLFENGSREHLLNTNGLSVEDISNKIEKFLS